LLLLDEPTTYLDISHQLEVLELCKKLNLTKQNTLVMVLHDLNLAARYADHLIVMKDGKIKGSDSPQKLINPSLLKEVFGIEALVTRDPVSKTPLVIPIT
jgi:iron complex transport system ATP-binding protein